MMRLFLSGIVFILISVSLVFSQGFTNINAGLTGTHWGDVAWGDYDADGDLDVIITGADAATTPVTEVYKNLGNDTFVKVTGLTIPGTYIGDVAWGDYDGDGYLDILIEGYTAAGQITALYRNAGNDSFVDSGVSFPALADGSVNFADYNNDGYLDVLVSGFDGNTYVTAVYRNNGDGTFTASPVVLPGTIKSAFEWVDFDRDGDLDIFLTGYDWNGNLISKLYRNDGNETFTETTNNFTGVWLGDASWGDFDNDGDPDLLLSGFTVPIARICKIYANNGDGTFSEIPSPGLIGVSHSSTIWGDYDNDGYLDVFICGTYEQPGGWVRVIDVFINNRDSTFTPAGFTFTADAFWGEAAWGDYDNDGDLDLICSGDDDVGGVNTIIYRNENPVANTVPTAPGNLFATPLGNAVQLSWSAATDAETPSAGLSYNGYIRNAAGEIIWNSMALLASGDRLVPALGNAQQDTQWTITNLPTGTYYWSVQAIDHNFAGSPFAPEDSFGIGISGIPDAQIPESISLLSNYPNPFNPSTTIELNLPPGENSHRVNLGIYEVTGKKVKTLYNGRLMSGVHRFRWNGSNEFGQTVASGEYLARISFGNGFVLSRKMLLLH